MSVAIEGSNTNALVRIYIYIYIYVPVYACMYVHMRSNVHYVCHEDTKALNEDSRIHQSRITNTLSLYYAPTHVQRGCGRSLWRSSLSPPILLEMASLTLNDSEEFGVWCNNRW